jgi:hypothetical protein
MRLNREGGEVPLACENQRMHLRAEGLHSLINGCPKAYLMAEGLRSLIFGGAVLPLSHLNCLPSLRRRRLSSVNGSRLTSQGGVLI